MARGRGRASPVGEWVQTLGEQLGAELGQIIAENVQRTLESRIDVGRIARSLGAGQALPKGASKRGRGRNARQGCAEPGCDDPVLAKGLCRSHYYRARYQAQKAGTLSPRGRTRPPPGRRGKRAPRTATGTEANPA